MRSLFALACLVALGCDPADPATKSLRDAINERDISRERVDELVRDYKKRCESFYGDDWMLSIEDEGVAKCYRLEERPVPGYSASEGEFEREPERERSELIPSDPEDGDCLKWTLDGSGWGWQPAPCTESPKSPNSI